MWNSIFLKLWQKEGKILAPALYQTLHRQSRWKCPRTSWWTLGSRWRGRRWTCPAPPCCPPCRSTPPSGSCQTRWTRPHRAKRWTCRNPVNYDFNDFRKWGPSHLNIRTLEHDVKELLPQFKVFCSIGVRHICHRDPDYLVGSPQEPAQSWYQVLLLPWLKCTWTGQNSGRQAHWRWRDKELPLQRCSAQL